MRCTRILALLGSLAVVVQAQDGPSEAERKPERVAPPVPEQEVETRVYPDLLVPAIDTNGDKEFSAEEIKAAPNALATVDLDGDGKISRAELLGGRPRPKTGPGRFTGFRNLDPNGDGKIEKDEVAPGMWRGMQKFDRDGDGALSKEEGREWFAESMRARRGRSGRAPAKEPGAESGGPESEDKRAEEEKAKGAGANDGEAGERVRVRPKTVRFDNSAVRTSRVFAALNTERNSDLSAEEIANAHAALATLDKNKDGKLSQAELAPMSHAEWLVSSLDKDGDGKLSKAECASSRAMTRDFDPIDTNKDGLLSLEELDVASRRGSRRRE